MAKKSTPNKVQGMHKMPEGHMMSDSEMNKTMSKKKMPMSKSKMPMKKPY